MQTERNGKTEAGREPSANNPTHDLDAVKGALITTQAELAPIKALFEEACRGTQMEGN